MRNENWRNLVFLPTGRAKNFAEGVGHDSQ
jgi:hypothetical protein